ncbi:NUDIX hydrolase [Pelistega europaea]|uniref:GDP-mannose pyrophosphatase n=1 Tax=Pelistega europaea TaxID=106147 RepID=A0A7Y4P4L0_9BURK|nr:NUDIX hydrolase [Pelistega europaea]NOL48823.1 NUDIX hydrolase [Pelistega europaea]
MDKTPQNLTETTLSSQAIFKGRIISVSLDQAQLPNGKTASREVVRHPGAVAILAVTDEQKVILVEQYRYPCGEVLLEIPAGKLDVHGEPPVQCAFRELAEETPYTAKDMTLLYTFYTAAGFCDELMYLYQAHGLTADSQASTDEDEFVRTVYLSRDEVQEALQSGKIRDSKTIIALQYWLLN